MPHSLVKFTNAHSFTNAQAFKNGRASFATSAIVQYAAGCADANEHLTLNGHGFVAEVGIGTHQTVPAGTFLTFHR